MRALLDVNALIAVVQPDHVHHRVVREWWSKNRSTGWASCPLTQNGFVRILSQPKNPAALTAGGAIGLLRRAIVAEDHAFWADDISLADPEVFDHGRILGPNQITDVYLLALAMKHGGRLVTLDQSIPASAVRGAQERHLVIMG